MRLILDGPVNVYYVQTLCMIFFPGAKFGEAEKNDPTAPEVRLTLTERDGGMEAKATVTVTARARPRPSGWNSRFGTAAKRPRKKRAARRLSPPAERCSATARRGGC